MITILHNPGCSKSNCSLDYLKNIKEPFEIRNYLENPLTVTELKDLLRMLDLPVEAIIRKEEPFFADHLVSKELSGDEWIEILAQHPILLQRPIIIKNGQAVIGRPIGKVIDLLK